MADDPNFEFAAPQFHDFLTSGGELDPNADVWFGQYFFFFGRKDIGGKKTNN